MADFEKWIVDRFGENGLSWLRRLPDIVNECVAKWDMKELKVQPISHYNYIAYCRLADNSEAVLKIGYPESEIGSEIAALQALRSEVMIKPLAINELHNAILLPFIKPGTPLFTFADDEKQTQIAANLIMNMPVSLAVDYNFPQLTDWFRKISDFSNEKKSHIPQNHLVDAAHIFGELQKADFSSQLLHGDFHHHNILKNSDRWIVIDPKGVIGNPLYETSCFLYNPSPNILKQNAEKILGKRIEIFVDILPYQAEEIAAMAYCQSILSAVWCIEDRQNCWQNAISFADIFRNFI